MSATNNDLCVHCGTPLPPGCKRFCCAGCAHVYAMLTDCGLDAFYEMRGNATLTPVPPQALRERDWQWLEKLSADAESGTMENSPVQLDLAVQGLSCLGCVWLIDSVFKQMPGAHRIEIHATRGTARITWQRGKFDVAGFARRLQQFGYLLGKPDSAPVSEGFSLGRRTGLCAAFAMNAMVFTLPSYLGMEKEFIFAPWFELIAACSATLALLVGGSYFAQRSIAALRNGVLHIDTPIILGIMAAWLGSMAGWVGGVGGLKYFDFVGIFIFLMLGGRWWQQSAVERNRRRLLQSTSIPESVGKVDADNHELITRLSDVAPGDVLRIKSGEVIPVTSVLRSLHATVSLEWINGESDARDQSEGQRVPSGALNIGSEDIEVECLEAWKESLLHRLSNASPGGCETVPFFAGLLRGYLAAVIIVGISGFIFWMIQGATIPQALQVMISVFIVSCPCALGVSAPFADDLAASKMERLGVFVRASGIWQKLARIRTLIFDKTGTLTMENPQLINPEALDALSGNERKMLRVLAASNLHPVSRSLFEALGATLDANQYPFDEVVGQGVRCTDAQGHIWELSRPASKSNEDCIFACDGRLIAGFRFRESLRPETVGAFNLLRQKSFTIHLLSGDRTEKVAQTAGTLGLPRDAWHAELTPAEKAAQVRQIDPAQTLFIGDGANDSLAFEAALCSGSPVTGRNFLEHRADFYFIGNSLRFVPQLLETAKLRQRAVRRVFSFALCYNIGAVAVSLSGHMSPLLAAILMPLSSVITLGIVRLTYSGERNERGAQFKSAERPSILTSPNQIPVSPAG